MAFSHIRREDMRLTVGELYAVRDVFEAVSAGNIVVGGVISRYFYRHMAKVNKQSFDKEMAEIPGDDPTTITEVVINPFSAGATLLRKTIDTAISHYAGDQFQTEITTGYAEDVNILRGLSSALNSRE
jgi:hypothetical protein